MGKIIHFSKILNVFIEIAARSVGDCGKIIEDKFRCYNLFLENAYINYDIWTLDKYPTNLRMSQFIYRTFALSIKWRCGIRPWIPLLRLSRADGLWDLLYTFFYIERYYRLLYNTFFSIWSVMEWRNFRYMYISRDRAPLYTRNIRFSEIYMIRSWFFFLWSFSRCSDLRARETLKKTISECYIVLLQIFV